MAKVLLTGATGFIGRNLYNYLCEKHEVCAPVKSELDLLDTKQVERYIQKKAFDVVIHTAAMNDIKNADMSEYDILNGNLQMFFNLERCKKYYGRMYSFGSGAEYDMEHYVPDMKEEYFGTYIPRDAYGFSKYIMSTLCRCENNIYDLRLFGVYGRYEEWERRFISNAICRVLTGNDITIRKNVYFDYLWVDDLCGIMEWFIDNTPKYKHYNVCRGSKIDLYSLAFMVREILGSNCDIVVSEEGWKPEYTGNNSRLIKEMGSYQFTDYKESVSELCAYYKKNMDLIDESRLL